MANLKKHITENGINYTLCGDYYIPDIAIEKGEQRSLGKYGAMRRAFLKEFKPILYNNLALSGKLFEHLYEIDDASHARIEEMMNFEIMWDKDIPDKKSDPMGWVQHMNMLKAQAEEVVFEELIYN